MFTENSKTARSTIKKNFILRVEHECAICSLKGEWSGKPLVLELDHINGIRNDNRIENLRLLCPNCHSQQKTSSRNFRIANKRVSDEIILDALKNSNSLREAILKVGCLDSGPTYVRFRKVARTYKIHFTKDKKEVQLYWRDWRTEPRPHKRKVERPSKEILEKEINESSFCALGRKYGVSDNAIRKWCKAYKINFLGM